MLVGRGWNLGIILGLNKHARVECVSVCFFIVATYTYVYRCGIIYSDTKCSLIYLYGRSSDRSALYYLMERCKDSFRLELFQLFGNCFQICLIKLLTI